MVEHQGSQAVREIQQTTESCKQAAKAYNLLFVGLCSGDNGVDARFQTKSADYFGVLHIDHMMSDNDLHDSLEEICARTLRGSKLQFRLRNGRAKRSPVLDREGQAVPGWWKTDAKTFDLLEVGGNFDKQTVLALDRTRRHFQLGQR